jgi:O-antigen/teichoic acid export membrane protein
MLIRHSALYLLGRIVPGVASLLAVALYTRLLTADQYGHYALILATVGVINAVCFQWLSLSLGRFLPAHDRQPEELLYTALIGFAILVSITGVLGTAVVWLWPDTGLRCLIILSVVVAWSQAWFDLNLKIINVRLAPIRYGFLTSVKALLALGFGAALVYLGFGAVGILLGLMIGLLIPTILVRKHWYCLSARHHNIRLLRDLLHYGAPLTLTFMLILVVDISDRFILAWLLNAKAVGAYAAAYDLTQQSLGMLMGVVYLAAFPLALRALEETGVEAAQEQLKENGLILLGVAIPATVGIIILAENIAFTILGAEFREEATNLIPVIALAIFVWGIKSYYLDYAFQLTRRTTTQIWPVAWAGLINICLNFFWIPTHGLFGAALATLVAFSSGAGITWYLGKKVFFYPPAHREIYKVIVASLGMASVILLIREWHGVKALLMQIAVGLFSYVVLLVILNTKGMRTGLRARFKYQLSKN